jgi:chemotaxis receptor (MCP) glutamine deamidase CheD
MTYELGSCIALAVHVPALLLTALVRFSRPTSIPGGEPPSKWHCAETGLPLLFAAIREYGASNHDLVVSAAGGWDSGLGRRNQIALRSILSREQIHLRAEDLGGQLSRTLWTDHTGRTLTRVGPSAPEQFHSTRAHMRTLSAERSGSLQPYTRMR